jgi:hypothetical protein
MFYIWDCIRSFCFYVYKNIYIYILYTYILVYPKISFGSISHVWEKICSLCAFEPGLLHLTWCPLIASIFFPTTCIIPYHWVKYPCVVYHIFLIHASVVGHLDCFHSLAILNRWTSIYRCLCCILIYVPFGRCPGVVSLDHMAILPSAFWRISILLSIMVVLISYSPPAMYRDSCFSRSFPVFVVVIALEYDYSN